LIDAALSGGGADGSTSELVLRGVLEGASDAGRARADPFTSLRYQQRWFVVWSIR